MPGESFVSGFHGDVSKGRIGIPSGGGDNCIIRIITLGMAGSRSFFPFAPGEKRMQMASGKDHRKIGYSLSRPDKLGEGRGQERKSIGLF